MYKNINLSDCVLLKDWLQQREARHRKKKAEVFTREEIDAYLCSIPEPNEENDLIMKKCVLVVGLYGLLRVSEMTNLHFQDIKEESTGDFVVKISTSKTDLRAEGWSYRVMTTGRKMQEAL